MQILAFDRGNGETTQTHTLYIALFSIPYFLPTMHNIVSLMQMPKLHSHRHKKPDFLLIKKICKCLFTFYIVSKSTKMVPLLMNIYVNSHECFSLLQMVPMMPPKFHIPHWEKYKLKDIQNKSTTYIQDFYIDIGSTTIRITFTFEVLIIILYYSLYDEQKLDILHLFGRKNQQTNHILSSILNRKHICHELYCQDLFYENYLRFVCFFNYSHILCRIFAGFP